MYINNSLLDELYNLEQNIESIVSNKNVNPKQMEEFLRNLEKRRYNILSQIKIHNKVSDYTDRVKNISDEYKINTDGNSLNIYIPEPMPSYKNLKTHAFKNILLNLIELTTPYANMFQNRVCIFITVYDNIRGWDIDNKFIKPISDALVINNVIEDDNIDKMFYCVKGEFSTKPHTEVYVTNEKNLSHFLKMRMC